MTMRRVMPLLMVMVAAGAGYWWWCTRVPATAPAQSPAGPRPQLGVMLELLPAGPDDDSVIVARVFDRGELQREALAAAEAATGRTWAGSTRALRVAPPAAVAPASWPTQITLTSVTPSGSSALAAEPATAREPNAALYVVRLPAGARVTAILPFDGRTVTSNVVTVPSFADAASLHVARGRVAEALSRVDALEAAATALLALDGNSVWGDYMRGAALELSGDRAGARAAYERALSHVVPSAEPPMGLILRIERTR